MNDRDRMDCEMKEERRGFFESLFYPEPKNKALQDQRLAEQQIARETVYRQCPEDIKEFGRRHGIPQFAELVWVNGWMAGYKQRQIDSQEERSRIEERNKVDGKKATDPDGS